MIDPVVARQADMCAGETQVAEVRLADLLDSPFILKLDEGKAHGSVRVAAHSAVHDAAAVCKELCQLGLSHLQAAKGLLSAMRASASQQPMLGGYRLCQVLLSCSQARVMSDCGLGCCCCSAPGARDSTSQTWSGMPEDRYHRYTQYASLPQHIGAGVRQCCCGALRSPLLSPARSPYHVSPCACV